MEPSQPRFCHPYEPYDIQLQFMEALYRCIEKAQIGIFESPTGTGKSLSLICGSLTWLRDHERRSLEEAVTADLNDSDDPPWMIEAAADERRKRLIQARQDLQAQISATRTEGERRQKGEESRVNAAKRQKLASDGTERVSSEDEQYALEDYESDDDATSANRRTGLDGLSASTALLLGKIQGSTVAQESGKAPIETRIFYCSRTHSQLTQFVHELRRVKLPAVIDPQADGTDGPKDSIEMLKHISLGSRKNLCVNDKVSKLKSTVLINDRCRELQTPGLSSEERCKYLPTKDEVERWVAFRNHALGRIRDIEDLGKLGRQLEVCPYYASRSAVTSSEIVTLPYPLLLRKSARETLKLALKDQIVIIDEAHNLMDAIASANSSMVSLEQIKRSISGITDYVQRFRTRLKGKNRVYVAQLLRLLQSVAACVTEKMKAGLKSEQIVPFSDLISGKGVDQINSHKLSIYLQESKLALKVEGYARNRKEKQQNPRNKTGEMHQDDLTTSQSFLIALMNPSAEGVVYLSAVESEPVLRYSLLDPKNHFRDIVEGARAIVLAGGTMSPMSDYINYLFPYAPTGRIATYSFGHVIPPESLLALSLSKGLTGLEFDFTFEKRRSTPMVLELGKTLEGLCDAIPDGIVVFLPSYEYLRFVLDIFKTNGDATNDMYSRLSALKPIFCEDKDQTQGGGIFERYAKSIDERKGGLLLSVVGGRLSEGINFSDRLGRAVVVVGLPFPNIHSAEWQAKIKHIEASHFAQISQTSSLTKGEIEAQAKKVGRDFYENACMRAVNQCIGRAIRHRNDYASILLLDRRYRSPRIHGKLPGWIRQSMTAEQEHWSYSDAIHGLKTFFENKI